MLKGKVAVVTGASRGIGEAIACKLSSLGADIAVIYAGNKIAAENLLVCYLHLRTNSMGLKVLALCM